MAGFYRGSTPTFSFTMPCDTSEVVAAVITFMQEDSVILEKRMNDSGYEAVGKEIRVTLTQDESFRFREDEELQGDPTRVQIRVKFANGGKVIPSNVVKLSVLGVLNNEVI